MPVLSVHSGVHFPGPAPSGALRKVSGHEVKYASGAPDRPVYDLPQPTPFLSFKNTAESQSPSTMPEKISKPRLRKRV